MSNKKQAAMRDQQGADDAIEANPEGNGLASPVQRQSNPVFKDKRTGKFVTSKGKHNRGKFDFEHVRRALLKAARRRDPQGVRLLQRMADKVMDKACEGDMEAVKFITERIDGKQTTSVTLDQNVTVSSVGQAHLEALNRLTNAVTSVKTLGPSEVVDVTPDNLDPEST